MIYLVPTDTCFGLACKINDINGYNEIYKLKNRDYSKLLAIIVADFDKLKEITLITEKQIEILKNYPRPFSVILSPKNKSSLISKSFENYGNYSKISFRVATKENKDIIGEKGAMFLTSANLSGSNETYSTKDFFDQFPKANIEILGNKDFIEKVPPSDIIEFGKNDEIIYLRKN